MAIAGKQGQKHSRKMVESRQSHPSSKRVAHLKSAKHRLAEKQVAKRASTRKTTHVATTKHHHRLPPPITMTRINDEAPAPITIPHIASQNRWISRDIEPIDNTPRIHSLIPANSADESVADGHRIPAHRMDAPGHYSSAHGVIRSSLAVAGMEAGLSDELITQLTRIFAWDIDFAANLHRGDQFTVVHELTHYGDEQIVAAEFVNEGRILTAVRYEDGEGNVGYYTPEGKAMRKAFLSTPVDYVRISSHFDANRLHPILNRIRAHKGVDYAARIGTPVKAAGDGQIAFVGRKGGYGQVVIVKHGERYETLYAHLSDFKKGLLEGEAVQQGDIIGYVGQTGLATGPHLHYEFRVDGVHRNPEHQEPRHLMALNGDLLADFKLAAHPALAQLYSTKAKTLLAKYQPNAN